MARRIRDVRHADFRNFTKDLEIAKRQVRELEPEAGPRETTIIHNDAECRAVMAYLLAKQRDAKAGGSAHLTAFQRDRQRARILRKVMRRIPPLPGTAAGA